MIFRACFLCRLPALWPLCQGLGASLVGCLFAVAVMPAAQAQENLTLQQSIKYVLRGNPQLQLFPLRLAQTQSARQTAALKPPLSIGFEAENVLGNEDLNGFDGGEFTLALASVIELEDKRLARLAINREQQSVVQTQQQVAALDALGTLTQFFIATLSTQDLLTLAAERVSVINNTLASVERRNRLGASANTEVLRVRAALAVAEIERDALQTQLLVQQSNLAALWGELNTETRQPPYRLQGDLYRFPAAEEFQRLIDRLESNPQLAQLTSRKRLEQATTTLAKANGRNNLEWEAGIRRLADEDATVVVASIRVPLQSRQRAQGEIERAQWGEKIAEGEIANRRAELYRQLFTTYTTRAQQISTVVRLRDVIVPALNQILTDTQTGYDNGRYDYLELSLAQEELFDARKKLIETATAAQQAQAIIEQLTAAPLNAIDGQ